MKTYHYYASAKLPGKMVQIDGILRTNKPVDSMERYKELKDLIIEDTDEPGLRGSLVIESLSIIDEG